jgi:hypothetical protein
MPTLGSEQDTLLISVARCFIGSHERPLAYRQSGNGKAD